MLISAYARHHDWTSRDFRPWLTAA